MASKWEGFTDRSLKILQLGNQEAVQGGYREIDTEHLLLGLIRERSGIAARVLEDFGVKWALFRSRIISMTRWQQPGEIRKLPFSSLAERVIDQARLEAGLLRQNYVGTSHLLLGLLYVEDGMASKALVAEGVTYKLAKQAIIKIVDD